MRLNPGRLKNICLKVIIGCFLFAGFCTFLSGGTCWSAETEGYRQIFDIGYVDWLSGEVVAKGVAKRAAKISKSKTEEFSREIARRSALIKARGNLLMLLEKVRIDSNILVRDRMQQKADVDKLVRKMVHNCPVLNTTLDNNATELSVGLSLRGSLSRELIPQGAWYEKVDYDPGLDFEYKEEQLPVPENQTDTSVDAEQKLTGSKLSRLTGLIIDARGIDTAPSLLCRLFNEQGLQIYDPQMVSQESAYSLGMAGYTQDMNSAFQSKRVGNNPLVVRAKGGLDLKTSQLVISNEEAELVKEMKVNSDHLQKCRVIIVLGPSDESELVEFPLY